MDTPEVLDQAVIDSLRQLTPPGEPDVLAEVLRLFLAEVPPRLARLRNACTAGNIEEVHRAAHSLKGSAGNIGARRMFDVSRRLDDLSKSGAVADAPRLIDELEVEFGKVESEIHRLLGV
jgi:HPt (histidine-containing phosphotransfer) domain-containing protein